MDAAVRAALARCSALVEGAPGLGELQAFHARHKMLLLAHDPEGMRACGRIVAQTNAGHVRAALDEYAEAFAAALSRPATRGGHLDALRHLAGHLPPGSRARKEAAAVLDAYENERVTLREAQRAIAQRLTEEGGAWALGQAYLEGAHGAP